MRRGELQGSSQQGLVRVASAHPLTKLFTLRQETGRAGNISYLVEKNVMKPVLLTPSLKIPLQGPLRDLADCYNPSRGPTHRPAPGLQREPETPWRRFSPLLGWERGRVPQSSASLRRLPDMFSKRPEENPDFSGTEYLANSPGASSIYLESCRVFSNQALFVKS